MKFIIRNQAKIANKYIRFAKWKIRNLNRKFGHLLYSEIYIKKISSRPMIYDTTIKLGVPGRDIIISARSSNLKKMWSDLSSKMKDQLRKKSSQNAHR